MKHCRISLTLFMLWAIQSAQAEETKATHNNSATLKIETRKDQSVLTGTMYRIWHKLRALSPTDPASTENKRIIATAGIRGSQTTDSLIQLYWKDDHTQDEAFIKEITLFNQAQTWLEKGDLPESKKTLERFIALYPDSKLKPNVIFSQALIASAQGEKQGSSNLFKQFIQDNPKHPLVSDAEAALNELSVKN